MDSVQRKLDQVRLMSKDLENPLTEFFQVNIGIVTYGLAFHTHKTTVLRHPYHDEKYFEQVFQL